MSERNDMLRDWIAVRKRATSEINVVKHMVSLLEEKVKAADRGLRQQQSAGIDEVLSDLHGVRTMLATIQNKLDEPPPKEYPPHDRSNPA